MQSVTIDREQRGVFQSKCPRQNYPSRALAGNKLLNVAIHGISRTGIGLVADQPVSPNKPILVEVYDHTKSSWQFHTIWTMHCTEQQDGQWLVGCSLLRNFTEQELMSVLGSGL
jgi:hypothetical protein